MKNRETKTDRSIKTLKKTEKDKKKEKRINGMRERGIEKERKGEKEKRRGGEAERQRDRNKLKEEVEDVGCNAGGGHYAGRIKSRKQKREREERIGVSGSMCENVRAVPQF